MAGRYLEVLSTPEVLGQQLKYQGRKQVIPPQAEVDPLTPEEIEFIGRRDSFYLASVSSSGWPYMQHRGGKIGFLQVVSPTRLAFADYKGNRQLLTTGNVQTNDRVSLFLMDYPERTRLKILGHAKVEDAREHPELVSRFARPEDQRLVERIFLIEVVSFDWNCQQHIAPRYTAEEVATAVQPLRDRIAELEAQLSKRSI